MNLNYAQRLLKAVKEVLKDPAIRGTVMHNFVYHDTWCKFYSGGECNCDPDIVLLTRNGVFEIDRNGASVRLADNITAKDGLLYRDGKVIGLPEADYVAQFRGFGCAEQLVEKLSKS
jgi:hypothetical protein